MTETQLKSFAHFIEKEWGIVYPAHNLYLLRNKIEEISKTLGLQNFDKLPNNFKEYLLNAVTNTETCFFREPKIFNAIETIVLPEWEKKNTKKAMRIWSAASSFGQEVYSLSILFSEWKKQSPHFDWQILATDLNEKALKGAKEGKYTQTNGLPESVRAKYFAKNYDTWEVKPELKINTTFQMQNLLDPFDKMGTFDLVFCCNVLIYQSPLNKTKIVDKIASILNPDGYLVLGTGESLDGLSDRYDQVRSNGVVLYKLWDQPQQTSKTR